jgi:hypothetical protein
MTREETLKLLEFLYGVYPNPKKTVTAAETANAWSLIFQDEPAANVYRAARLHIQRSPYFPTISDINDCMQRAVMLYDIRAAEALPAPDPQEAGQDQTTDIDELWEWLSSD